MSIGRLRHFLMLDRTLGYALAARIWQSFAGLLTAALLLRYLSIPERGVYYTLIQVVGVQAYFELGLLNVLITFSGHETAVIDQLRTSAVSSDQERRIRASARMVSLVRSAFRWFGFASILYVIIAACVGYYTLLQSSVPWLTPMLVLLPVSAISVALAPTAALLEGSGFRDAVYRFRFFQAFIGSLVVWFTLINGFGIWATVAASSVQATMMLILAVTTYRPFFKQFQQTTLDTTEFSWSRDVLPMQWRMAVISLTFHFATQCFVIIVTMFHGDSASGPLGLTLSMTSAIQMLALAWVQSRYSVAAAHHGRGDREAAGTIWRQTAVVSTSILLVGFMVLVGSIAILPLVKPGLEQNFLPSWQVALLGIGCLSNHITAVQGFYVLSRKARPLFTASLIGSFATSLAVWLGGCWYATAGVVSGYAAAMTLIFLPCHSIAYLRFRGEPDATDQLNQK